MIQILSRYDAPGLDANGVCFDEAPPESTRFVIVSVRNNDGRRFDGRSMSAPLLVKAVVLTTMPNANTEVREAATRIDVLLDAPPDHPRR